MLHLKKKRNMLKKNYKFILLPIILGFTPCILFSQDSLKFSQIVNLALEQNYQVQIVKNEQIKSSNNNSYGGAGFYPTLDFSGNQTWSTNNINQTYYTGENKATNNAQSNVTAASLNLNWNIFDGFQMFANKNKLGYLEQLGKANTKYYIEQTIADLAQAYFQYIKESFKLKLYFQSLDVSRNRLELEKTKFNLGNTSIFTVQQAELDFNNDSTLVIEQEILLNQLKISINKIINRQLDTDFLPSLDFDLKQVSSLEELKNSTFKNNVQLNQQQIAQLISNENVKIQESTFYPILSLFSSYNYSNQNSAAGLLKVNNSHGISYGLNIRFNLFNADKDQTSLQNLKIDEKTSEIQTKQVKQNVESVLLQTYEQYQSYKKELVLQQHNVELAQNTLEIAKKQYELGTINGFDFRQVQLDFLTVGNKLNDLYFAIKSLEINLFRISGEITKELQ